MLRTVRSIKRIDTSVFCGVTSLLDISRVQFAFPKSETMKVENGIQRLTATKKRQLRRKKSRQLQKQQKYYLLPFLTYPCVLSTQSTPEESNPETSTPEDYEVEYVSAPRDFSKFFLDENSDSNDLRKVLPFKPIKRIDSSDSDSDDGGHKRTGFSRRRSPTPEDKVDGLAAVNQVELEKEFDRIFNRFASVEDLMKSKESTTNEEKTVENGLPGIRNDPAIALGGFPLDDDLDMDISDDEVKISKKKRKLQNQLRVAELKQICPKPEVVEVWDVTAADPRTLVYLKSYRNSIPVPRHWSQKRKYLQGKRGIEKPAFKLPDYIEATGISLMRQSYQDKEDSKKLQQKQKEKMRPKMGKMDIDYTILHDAFFRYQTKPGLSRMGELYYEGKEYEAKVKNLKPGLLSEELRKALGMVENTPPPWLINMQRYGPPPSYPSLKVPGLNAPIPPNSTFGYQAGGWGKPPVDEQGNPLYGDVFGEAGYFEDSDLEVDKTYCWGDLDSEAEESSEEEEEEVGDDEEEEEVQQRPSQPPTRPQNEEEESTVVEEGNSITGSESVISGMGSSVLTGLETPDVIDLRKASEKAAKQLYTVLEQKKADIDRSTLMGSDHVYVVPPDGEKDQWPVGSAEKRRTEKGDDVDVTFDPAELEGLDEEAKQKLYEEKLRAARENKNKEDFSEMVAAKAVQQKRKLAAKKDNFKF